MLEYNMDGSQFNPCHLCDLQYNHAEKLLRKSILFSCIWKNYFYQQDIFAWAPVHPGYPCYTSRYQGTVSKDEFLKAVVQVK